MSDLSREEFEKLKRQVEDAKAEADRAQGAYDQLMERLKKEFNCKTLEEAKILLVKIQRQREEAGKVFQTKMDDYKRKWKKPSTST